jgi:hypothetical protein
MCAGILARYLFDTFARSRDKSHARTAVDQLTNEREAESRSATRNRDP